jgi:hypothetical protein
MYHQSARKKQPLEAGNASLHQLKIVKLRGLQLQSRCYDFSASDYSSAFGLIVIVPVGHPSTNPEGCCCRGKTNT